jgi:hypothetical protein
MPPSSNSDAMKTEPDAAAADQLPTAAVAAAPLFVSIPASRLLQLPAALLTELTNLFLEDQDTKSLAQTCSAMPPLLRSYRIKTAVSLSFALLTRHSSLAPQTALPVSAATSLLLRRAKGKGGASLARAQEWVAHMRFGVPTTVFIDAATSMDCRLGDKLQRLPLRVRHVHVHRAVFAVEWWPGVGNDSFRRKQRNFQLECSDFDRPECELAAVVWQLPDHVRSLISEHDGCSAPAKEQEQTAETLPPFSRWTLPDGLTELQLPHFLPLDNRHHLYSHGWDSVLDGAHEDSSDEEWQIQLRPAGPSISEEAQKEQPEETIQLPDSLVILRLGAELDHSLTHVRLPSSLRVLHFGAAWSQPAHGWPQLPDGLEELVLPSTFPHPLSSLKLPASLRRLHFLPLARATEGPLFPSKSRLLEEPAAGMFPPALESLRLPCSIRFRGQVQRAASIHSPLDISLLPASLRFLRLSNEQSLCCTGDAALALQKLRLDTFEASGFSTGPHVDVRRRTPGWQYGPYRSVYGRFHGPEDCRADLQRMLNVAVAKADKDGGGPAPLASLHPVAPSAASALPFTMGTSQRG